MPEMDGIEAVRQFRAFEAQALAEGTRSQRQLIVGMSANSNEETHREALGKDRHLFLSSYLMLRFV